MVVRDSFSVFIAGRSCFMDGIFYVKEGEAMGLYHALNWIQEVGFQKVIFELDVDAIRSSRLNFSEFGTLISVCRSTPR